VSSEGDFGTHWLLPRGHLVDRLTIEEALEDLPRFKQVTSDMLKYTPNSWAFTSTSSFVLERWETPEIARVFVPPEGYEWWSVMTKEFQDSDPEI